MSAIGDVPLLAELALSLGLGLLIGVQRGWTLRHEAAAVPRCSSSSAMHAPRGRAAASAGRRASRR